MSGMSPRPFFTVIYIVFALFVSHLSAQNSVHFYSTSSRSVSPGEEASASVIVEQSNVASGRSINDGSFSNINQHDRPLKTTGFAFKDKNSLNGQVNGKTSPVPFVIPSYASGIIFRDSDNDRTPQVEIQPAIDISSKTIGPQDASSQYPGTQSTFNNFNPTTNAFQPNTFTSTFQTTPSTSITEDQNISPIQSVATTLAPSSPNNANPTANDARFSNVNRRIEILGLQAPGYAVRRDGTIDSDAIPTNFRFNSPNSPSDSINPLNFESPTTTTQRITRTTQQNTNPWLHSNTQTPLPSLRPRFIPSADNPFLPRSNLVASAEQTTIPSTTQTQFTTFNTQPTFKGFTSFGSGTPIRTGQRSSSFVPTQNSRTQHAISAFAPINSAASSSAFGNSAPKNGNFNPKFTFNNGNNNFGNQPFSRQSNNDLSSNAQQQQNTPFVTEIPPTETTTGFVPSFPTTQSTIFASNPTNRAPAAFTFSAFPSTTITTSPPTTRPFNTISTAFQPKFTTTLASNTISPNEQSSNEPETPSIELLPPIDASSQAKSAFAPINDAGAQAKLKSTTFPSTTIQTQRPFVFKTANTIKPVTKTNAFLITTRTPFRTTFATRFPTFPPIIFTTTTTSPTTTDNVDVAIPSGQLTNPIEPSSDLLPPEEDSSIPTRSDISSTNNASTSKSTTANPTFSLPADDLLPPINSPSATTANDSRMFRSSTIATTTTNATSTAAQSELDLDPFLPPAESTSNNDASADQNAPNTDENDFTAISQNPFGPQLDLNPWLPPFFSDEKSTDAPPPLEGSSSTIHASTVHSPTQNTVFGNVPRSSTLSFNANNAANSAQNRQQHQDQEQQTPSYRKYTGGFNGPPGILSPYDNKANRG